MQNRQQSSNGGEPDFTGSAHVLPGLEDVEPTYTPEQVFGRRLRQEREREGLTQTWLAAQVSRFGVRLDPTAITRIEKGDRGVRLNEAVAIAAALDCSLSQLLDPSPMPDIEVLIAQAEAEVRALQERAAVAAHEEQRSHHARLEASAAAAAAVDLLTRLQQERDRIRAGGEADG